MGSSAGGHLAGLCAALHEQGIREPGESAEKNDGRPDFVILCYAVISGINTKISHQGSFINLLGNHPTEEQLESVSLEKITDENAPAAFIWHTWQDQVVPVQNSLFYAARLKECGVECDLHVYEKGYHGIGLCGGHPWTTECLRWLSQR